MHRVWDDHEDPHSPHRLLTVPLYPHAYKAEEQALAADLSFLVWHTVSDIDFFWPAVVSVLEAPTWESYSMYVMPHLRTVEPCPQAVLPWMPQAAVFKMFPSVHPQICRTPAAAFPDPCSPPPARGSHRSSLSNSLPLRSCFFPASNSSRHLLLTHRPCLP